jgi:hypothetical protein
MGVWAALGRSTRKVTFSPVIGNSLLLPFATAAMAAVIFVADVMTGPEVALAVLYVAVVLVAARFCRTRGIAVSAAGCALLTLLTWFYGGETPVNAAIAILAIEVTAFLLSRGQSAEDAVRRSERALQEARMELAHVARVTKQRFVVRPTEAPCALG